MTTHSKLCEVIRKWENNQSLIKINYESLATEIMKSIKPCSCLSCVVEMNVGALYSRKFYGFKDCPYCEGRGWVIKLQK